MATSRQRGALHQASAAPHVGHRNAVQAGMRTCLPCSGELARSRVITAEGQDFVVATVRDVRGGQGYLTGAYPVSRGYLVMMRQPLCEFHNDNQADARERHDQLANVLVEAGVRVVRARASLAERKRAETREARAARGASAWTEDSLDTILGSIEPAEFAASRS